MMSRVRVFRFTAFFLSSAFVSFVAPFRTGRCADCFEPHGWPFTSWHDGGFAGGAGWVPIGVAGDFVVCALVAIIGSTMWGWLAVRAKRKSDSSIKVRLVKRDFFHAPLLLSDR